MLLERQIKMPERRPDAAGDRPVAAFFRSVIGRLFSRPALGENAASNSREAFESRYENELFLAEELMSRGGALSPEDHAWLTKLIDAYEATSSAKESSPQIEDPWAADTQPEIFETEPTDEPAPAAQSACADHDVVGDARKLREEGANTRRHLRSELAKLSREWEQLRRAAGDLKDLNGRLPASRVDIEIPPPGSAGNEDEPSAGQGR